MIAELRALEAGGMPGQVRGLIDLFLRESEGHARTLRGAVDGRDRPALERATSLLASLDAELRSVRSELEAERSQTGSDEGPPNT